MKKRILVISWYFPPINSSEGIVTYKLLNNSKNEYDVFCQSSNLSWSYKKSESLQLNDNIVRYETKGNSFEEFYIDAINFYKKNKSKYDIVMTRSMPEIDHKIGLEIKRINPKVTWIASFGDPIANNPYVIRLYKYDNYYSIKKRYERPMSVKEMFSFKRVLKSMLYNYRYKNNYKTFVEPNKILEKDILNCCDCVIYNSSYQKEFMLSFYDNKEEIDKKTLILPHSFDEKLYPYRKTQKKDKMIFNFIGHLDDTRTPKLLFNALEKLKLYDENLGDKVEFNFYGDISNTEKVHIIDSDLLDVVHLRKPVDYLKSLEIMKNSDWLIHIDANISEIVEKNIFFAAKIADYIGSGNKILALTMIDGISADILKEYNSLCLELNSEEIYNYLYKIIYEDYSVNQNKEYASEYNAVNVAKKFDKYIKKCEGKK